MGLGNPGEDYARTRHNAGFRVVEALADAEGIRIRSREAGARVGRGTIAGQPVLLALPQTFMNASGEAVAALCQKNGIDAHDLCVVLDEIELPLGTLRMRRQGSSGGHNGLASVITHLGSSGFARLRVGVRGPRYRKGQHDLADYVLDRFARDEGSDLENAVARAVEALRLWISEGADSAMRFANARTSSPGPASDPD